MKLMASAIVTLAASFALANPPTTTTTTNTGTTPTAPTKATTTTTTTTTTTADAKMPDWKKACEGKTGAELKTCETEMKKAHKK